MKLMKKREFIETVSLKITRILVQISELQEFVRSNMNSEKKKKPKLSTQSKDELKRKIIKKFGKEPPEEELECL
jgi:hypothetical protein